MLTLPFNQRILLLIALIALLISDRATSALMTSSPNNINVKRIRGAGLWFPYVIITLCCLPKSTFLFLILTLASIGFTLNTYGDGDIRYVSRKFIAYSSVSIGLLLLIKIFQLPPTWNTICVILAFGILMAIYPFNGWLDTFCLRAPSQLIATWLVVVRPCLVAHFLGSIQTFPASSLPIVQCLAWLTLVFVPILFFAQSNLRRTVGRIICWQGGYIWLFISLLPSEKPYLITKMANIQGVFLALISQVGVAIAKNEQSLDGLFKQNYFLALFWVTSFTFLIILLPIFLLKQEMPQISLLVSCAALATMVLPAIFLKKTYDSMK